MSDWPYKIEDYPPKYIKHMRERYGDDNAWILKILANDWEMKPDEAPHDMLTADMGAMIVFQPSQEPEVNGLVHLGKAYKDIATHADGTVWFDSDTDEDEQQVAERINWCRTMCKAPFYLQSWPVMPDSPDLQQWFVIFTTKQDASAYKLAYGGSI